MCFAGLMEFKELFGSFTGHRVENRSTRTRYGSTGSARRRNRRIRLESPSPTGPKPSATASK
ncbi:hypothetical protein HanHA300_Chr01g0014001 [Helianthus annuus]|nr:hypothetical protein HanHA300_Chr01g0014001 [Helianthus annuus]KAJ0622329.1 hypothetical protein HanIR_Chr01g0018771 [Helianthus annuus]KAJ0626602.1 hypothetical protein HanHA89_Chr01g0015051 [Helianthus annuus]